MLSKPPHIASAHIDIGSTLYKWDEWNVKKAYQPAEPQRIARFAALSHRANVAMCAATAEWVIWRFEKLSNDPTPYQYLEAAWASIVHNAYARYIETVDDDWRGVVRGPMNIALLILIDVIWGIEDTTPGENAAWMTNLAELVLPDPAPLRAWQEPCLARLEAHYARAEPDPDDMFGRVGLGPWVPRELFDLTRPFDPSMTRGYLQRFLNTLDWRSNRFLHRPEEMLAFNDYQDTPYELPEDDSLNRPS